MTEATAKIEVQATPYGETTKPKLSETSLKDSVSTESLYETESDSMEQEEEGIHQSTPTRPSSIEVRKSTESGHQGDLDATFDESVSGDDDEAFEKQDKESVQTTEDGEVGREGGIKRTNSKVKYIIAALEQKVKHERVPSTTSSEAVEDNASRKSSSNASRPSTFMLTPNDTELSGVDAGTTKNAVDQEKDAQKNKPRRKNFIFEWRTTKEVDESVPSQEAAEVDSQVVKVSDSHGSRSTNTSKSRRSSQSFREKAAKIKAALSKPKLDNNGTHTRKEITNEERNEPVKFNDAAAKIGQSFEKQQNAKKPIAKDDKMEAGKFNAVAEKLALFLKPRAEPTAPMISEEDQSNEKKIEVLSKEVEPLPPSSGLSTCGSTLRLLTAVEVNLNERTLKGYDSESGTEDSDEKEQEKQKKDRKADEMTTRGDCDDTGPIATVTCNNAEGSLNTQDTPLCTDDAPPDTEVVSTESSENTRNGVEVKDGENRIGSANTTRHTDPIITIPFNNTEDVIAATDVENLIGSDDHVARGESFDQVHSPVQNVLRDVCFENSIERTLSMDTEVVHQEEEKQIKDTDEVEAVVETVTVSKDEDEHVPHVCEMLVAAVPASTNRGRGMSMLESVNSETGSVTKLSDGDTRGVIPETVEMNNYDEEASIVHETEKITEQEAIGLAAESLALDVVKETVEQTVVRSFSLPVTEDSRESIRRRPSYGKLRRIKSSDPDDGASVVSGLSASSKKSSSSRKSVSSRLSRSSRRKKAATTITEIPTEVGTPKTWPSDDQANKSSGVEDAQYEPLTSDIADDMSVEVSARRDYDSHGNIIPNEDESVRDSSFLQLKFAEDSEVRVVAKKAQIGPVDCDVSIFSEASVEMALQKDAVPHENNNVVLLAEELEETETNGLNSKGQKLRKPLRSAAKGIKKFFTKKRGGKPPLPVPKNAGQNPDNKGLAFAAADVQDNTGSASTDSNEDVKGGGCHGPVDDAIEKGGNHDAPSLLKTDESEGNLSENSKIAKTTDQSTDGAKQAHGLFHRGDKRDRSSTGDATKSIPGQSQLPRRSRSFDPKIVVPSKTVDNPSSRGCMQKNHVKKEAEGKGGNVNQVRSLMSVDRVVHNHEEALEDEVSVTILNGLSKEDCSPHEKAVETCRAHDVEEETENDKEKKINSDYAAVKDLTEPSLAVTQATIAHATAFSADAALVEDLTLSGVKQDSVDNVEEKQESECQTLVKSSR